MSTASEALATGPARARESTEPEIWDVSVGAFLRRTVATHPDRTAMVDAVVDPTARRRWSYAEVLHEAERRARWLAGVLPTGSRVAICAPNSGDWLLVQYALALAGMVMVPVNPSYRVRELEHVLADSDAVAVVHAPCAGKNDLGALLDEVLERLPLRPMRLTFADLDQLSADEGAWQALPAVRGVDLVQVQYTSGTTGFPKGAVLRHSAVLNNARFVAEGGGMPDGGVWINAMPIFHLGSNVTAALGALCRGGTHVLAPRFDAALMLELIESEGGDVGLFVPTMLADMLAHPDRTGRDLSTLTTVFSGATAVPVPLVDQVRRELGCGVVILYGQTETSGNLTRTDLADSPEDQSQTVGRPLPGMVLRIVDQATGRPLPAGSPGEVVTRGYQTMVGYLHGGQPDADVFDQEGWLRTGDVGILDDRGYLRVVGRTRDVIVRGGMNIYPREIEEVLDAHPDLLDAAVVGVPEDRLGEIVAAVVRTAPGTEAEGLPDRLVAHCRTQLASYKMPVRWFVVEDYPLTPTEKVQKNVLQEWIASGRLSPAAVSGAR